MESTLGHPQTILMPSDQGISPRHGRDFTPAEREAGRLKATQAREAAQAAQAKATEVTPEGYTLRPAIGTTGGVDNGGWELIPPKGQGPVWYLGARQLAVLAIPRHLARYRG